MLKGDLTSTPLAPLLVQLADEGATGCLHVSDAEGDEALIYFKAGQVYAVSVPGRRPQLGAKLVSSGALAPEALADALEAQRTELQGWRLGELLVHLGYVDQPVVEAFVKEQVHDALWDLMRWSDGRWKFRKNEKTREDVAPPVPVTDLLANLRDRGYEWETISSVVHGPTAVPVLSTGGGGSPEMVLDPDAWSMLCKIDGERSVAELARDCGYTLFEAGQILVTLVSAGLVDIEEDVEVAAVAATETESETDESYGVGDLSSALAAVRDEEQAEEALDDEDGFAALARVVSEVAASVRGEEEAAEQEQPSQVSLHPVGDQSFASSLARVSEALSNVLGPAEPTDDPFAVPNNLRMRRAPKEQPPPPEVTPEQERRQRTRAAAAAELAAAHALAEALRAAQNEPVAAEAVADVVDLATVRRENEEEAARVEAERVEAEEEAARLEAERAEAERVEAERIAAEEEAARLEAERVAAEEAARVAAEEEAARLEAERVAEEEAARLAAEEAARLEAEEAARVAAEEEAARVAAEEEAARVAAEEEAARLEAERIAAEEEAARVAAEEAARLEAERVAAEEAARLEAEEAERIAAEEEAARVAAEEAARLEAERVAAEAAEQLAAEAAAAALVAEVAEAESDAWSEYWQREADAVQAQSARGSEASALLAELAADNLGSAVIQPDPVHQPEPVRQPEPEPEHVPAYVAEFVEPEVEEPAEEVREPAAVGAMAMSEYTDTAALLRELSSLGVEDDGPAPNAPPSAPPRPRPAAAASADKKKKRGLFGR